MTCFVFSEALHLLFSHHKPYTKDKIIRGFIMDQLIAQLKRHEGFKEHVYRCSAGKLTIGYGYNLDANPLELSSVEINFARMYGMAEQEAERLLTRMVGRCIGQLDTALPWIDNLGDARENVLINMAYNMGIVGLLKFTKTLALIKSGDYPKAADAMLKSRWAAQVGRRAVELAEQMRSGTYGA
jgi:lysozyme